MFNDIKRGGLACLSIGAAGATLVPRILPIVARAARPVLHTAVQGGVVCFDSGRKAWAEMGEVLDDFLARVQGELETGASHRPGESGGHRAGENKPEPASKPAPESPGHSSQPNPPGQEQPAQSPEKQPVTKPTGEPDPEVMG